MKISHSLKIKKFLLETGLFSLCSKLFDKDSVAILRYHSVVNPEDNYYAHPGICISPCQFERQIAYMASNYNIVSLDTVVDCVNNKVNFPENSVVITFDDGYRDNYRAYEIMKKYNATGTFYITAECIDGKKVLWLFEVRYLVINIQKEKIELNINGDNLVFSTENRNKCIDDITVLIKSNDIEEREIIMEQLRGQVSVDNYDELSGKVMLSWDQVREMSENGMTIGGHTNTHCNLPNARLENAIKEINGCKEIIERNLHTPVKHFSYPNSGPYPYFNNEIKEVVRRAGFVSATTSADGFMELASDLFEIRRVRVTENLCEIICFIELNRLKK